MTLQLATPWALVLAVQVAFGSEEMVKVTGSLGIPAFVTWEVSMPVNVIFNESREPRTLTGGANEMAVGSLVTVSVPLT